MGSESLLQRSTKDQIVCYLDFVKQHPELKLTSKLESADLKRNELLWNELTAKLNALKGPKRTREKWRQSLTHWRNQIRSRARKEKAAKSGVCQIQRTPWADDESFELELQNIAMIQNEIVKMENVESENEDEQPTAVASDSINDAEMQLPPSAVAEKPQANRSPLKRQEMFEIILNIMRDNEERDKRLHEEKMNCFKAVTDSIGNLTNAVTTLTEVIKNRKI